MLNRSRHTSSTDTLASMKRLTRTILFLSGILIFVGITEVHAEDSNDLYKKWTIQYPVIDLLEPNNTLVIDYGVSALELASSNAYIQHNVYTRNCSGPDLSTYSEAIRSNIVDPVTGEHIVQLDPLLLAWNDDIFFANYTDQTAQMKFCLHYSLWNADGVEINYVYVLLTLNLNLAGDFGFTNLVFKTIEGAEEAKEEMLEGGFHTKKVQEKARVRVYLCDQDTHEEISPPPNGYGLGDTLSICVSATPNLLKEGMYLKGVDNFKWTRRYWKDGEWLIAEQWAVKDGVPDALSEYYCPPFALFCTFTTMLIADFFSAPGYVVGEGGAGVGFGLPAEWNATDHNATRTRILEESRTDITLRVGAPNVVRVRSLREDSSNLKLLILLRGLDDMPFLADVPVLLKPKRDNLWIVVTLMFMSGIGLGAYMWWKLWYRRSNIIEETMAHLKLQYSNLRGFSLGSEEEELHS